MTTIFRNQGPSGDAIVDLPDQARDTSGRLLDLYAWLLGPLLAGYLLFDRAFAYLHIPGTPLYVGEMVLVIGGIGVLAATGYLRVAVTEEPMLTLLVAFILWGLIRFLPGMRAYGINAIRDSALWYYCLFALFTAAALVRSPDILGRWVVQLGRLTPWLLMWLPLGLLLPHLAPGAPYVPTTTVSVLSHKSGNAAIAAVLVLGSLWLFPAGRSAQGRGAWSIVALVVMALAATQNRGGLLGAAAGMAIGLAFYQDRLRLILRAVVVISLVLGVAILLSLKIPATGSAVQDQRAFSASQLIANVASIAGANETGNLAGTVNGRERLWSQVFQKQTADGRLIRGYGFGPNLAYLAGGLTAGGDPADPLRSPHNSHLNVLARMGLVGLFLWIALWVGWYWHLVAGCRRLAQRGLHARRQVAVLCMMVTTAILVSSFFDPQLEGAQVAALLWTAFGIGVAVSSFRAWFGDRDVVIDAKVRRHAPRRNR